MDVVLIAELLALAAEAVVVATWQNRRRNRCRRAIEGGAIGLMLRVTEVWGRRIAAQNGHPLKPAGEFQRLSYLGDLPCCNGHCDCADPPPPES